MASTIAGVRTIIGAVAVELFVARSILIAITVLPLQDEVLSLADQIVDGGGVIHLELKDGVGLLEPNDGDRDERNDAETIVEILTTDDDRVPILSLVHPNGDTILREILDLIPLDLTVATIPVIWPESSTVVAVVETVVVGTIIVRAIHIYSLELILNDTHQN